MTRRVDVLRRKGIIACRQRPCLNKRPVPAAHFSAPKAAEGGGLPNFIRMRGIRYRRQIHVRVDVISKKGMAVRVRACNIANVSTLASHAERRIRILFG